MKTRDDMPQNYTVNGRLPMDLVNAVSDAMHAAMTRGMTADEACCVAVACIADYWRHEFGNDRLPVLADVVIARGEHTSPEMTQ